MKDIGVKIAILLGVAAAIVTSIPLLAQETDASASDSAKVTYAPAGGGFGDQAASHAWEMSSITGELQTRLDSKTAKPGDPVVLKTIEKAQTSDGTMIPKGSRLIGHVTQAQAYSKEHGAALLGIAIDRAELRGGHSVAIYTLIRGATLGASVSMMNSMDSGNGMGAPMGAPTGGGGMMVGDPGMGAGRGGGGSIGGAGGAINGAGSMAGGAAGGAIDRNGATAGEAASSIDDQVGPSLGSTENATVETAGHGDMSATGAHAAAAARAVPRPTGIPGVMLSGSSSASGLFLSSTKTNLEFESGMRMQLGIVAKD
jgi:hypothetical protein